MNVLLVSSKSTPQKLAGAIVAAIHSNEKESVELQAVGAGAVNQAVKSLAVARGYIAPSGHDLSFTSSFVDVTIQNEDRTAIKFTVKKVKI